MFSYLTGSGTAGEAVSPRTYDIVVVGIGAMGGGIARALVDSPVSSAVRGFDLDPELVRSFHAYAASRNKSAKTNEGGAAPTATASLEDSGMINEGTDVVVVVLQTESQCEQVCFGNSNGKKNLLQLAPKGSCVILCSTVTASWTRKAGERFEAAGVRFVDAPVSGGPARARGGRLTVMSSGREAALEAARPVLEAVADAGRQLHAVGGAPGAGSTVKMIHQSLAGIHIVAAAEALALGARAGCDVEQLYEIVCGAAGSSWMFGDRGKRMIDNSADEVKSQLQIFVKDLDIVYNEAKKLRVPVPLASTALQQFIAGQSLGLSRKDDSTVVQVYENVTGVSVSDVVAAKKRAEEEEDSVDGGNEVGDVWTIADDDGKVLSSETILEVGDEPRHKVVLSNEYIRALRVHFPPGDTTIAHRHDQDSLYFFLSDEDSKSEIVNHVKGQNPVCDCVDFGEIRYGTHKTDKPLIHKITNGSKTKWMLCVDAEVLKKPPVTSIMPLMDPTNKHELVKKRDKCRVYKLTLEPDESITDVTYNFFHLSVVVSPSTIEKSLAGGAICWQESPEKADVSWKEPTYNLTKKNVGKTTYVEYIAEWC